MTLSFLELFSEAIWIARVVLPVPAGPVICSCSLNWEAWSTRFCSGVNSLISFKIRDSLSSGVSIIDSLTFESQKTDVSMGRDPSNFLQWKTFANPTPGFPNN